MGIQEAKPHIHNKLARGKILSGVYARMSDSDWRKHVTLALTLAFACIWLWLVAWSFITPLEYDPSQYPTEAASRQDREDSDARAQVWVAHAAWWQVGIGIAGLIGLGLTVYFAGRAWIEAKRGADAAWTAAVEAKRQADAAEDQLRDSRRPFVWVEYFDVAIEPRPKVTLRFTNIGRNGAVVIGGRAKLAYSVGIPQIPKTRIEIGAENVKIIALFEKKLLAGESFTEEALEMIYPDPLKDDLNARLWVYGLVDFIGPSGDDFTLPFLAFYGREGFVPLSAGKVRVMTRSQEIQQMVQEHNVKQGAP